MTTYQVRIVGTTPIIVHADSVEWADFIAAWRGDPKNKGLSKAGDDRTPPFSWMGCLNYSHAETGFLAVPGEYLAKALMGGAAGVPTGRGKATFKSLSQSGLLCGNSPWPLLVDGKKIQMSEIRKLRDLATFGEHLQAVRGMGFDLLVKRARIGQQKHIRVRPIFHRWSTEGEILVLEDQLIKRPILEQFLELGGRLKGLGDWRPGAPTPGNFGMFKAVVEG
jgi:hypothetical protein